MQYPNERNVYLGPDALKKYFNPDCQPPLPLIEIPESLNPFAADGVKIYAKMMTMHPANNVKALPAMNMLERAVAPGKTNTIIEYSSGSTVISMSMVSRVFHGISDTRAYLSNKTSDAKLKLMQFFGLDITLFGGPSQPEPYDHRGGIQNARRSAALSEGIVNPNQYENDDNWKAHVRWTGPQILKQLPQINVLCAGLGTSGTMTGLGMYFNQAKPSVAKVAVCTAAGDRVPGPRSEALLAPVKFPWKAAVDHMEHVGSVDSYSWSMRLCREGLVCGPSSGFNLQGLFQFLEKRKDAGTLKSLAGEDGSIHCVFICCDLPYQYIGEYFSKLGPDNFHPIHNQNLTKVDLYRYDEAWEREAAKTLPDYYSFDEGKALFSQSMHLQPNAIVLDLRTPGDFAQQHLPQASNLPLQSLASTTPGPFSDPAVLEKQWLELEGMLKKIDEKSTDPILGALSDAKVLVVCYGGDTSRVATSVLRAKGIEADSLRGGMNAVFGSFEQNPMNVSQLAAPLDEKVSATISVTETPAAI